MSELDDYLEKTASALELLADLFLSPKESCQPVNDQDYSVPCNVDRRSLSTSTGSEDPYYWVQFTAFAYIAEAANELRSLAVLIRARLFTGTLGPVVRAVVERVGIVCWILELNQDTDASDRAYRAMLNMLYSSKQYRSAIGRLDPPRAAVRELEGVHRTTRADVVRWFAPHPDPTAPKEETLWERKGEKYPELTDFGAIALSGSSRDAIHRGVYAALCGMTHPNIAVSAEKTQGGEPGSIVFVHKGDHVDRVVRLAIVAFSRGLQYLARYFLTETSFDEITQDLRNISAGFEDAATRMRAAGDQR